MIRRRRRIVDLPLNATEDRVSGSVDVARALESGERALEPGLLAEANRGILYVDEINLLDDHLTDVLLDAAALGVNVVEREGVSVVASGALPARRDDERGGGRASPADRRPDRARGRGRGARRPGVRERRWCGGARRSRAIPTASGRSGLRRRPSWPRRSRPRKRASRRSACPIRSTAPSGGIVVGSGVEQPSGRYHRSSSARRRSLRSAGRDLVDADDVLQAAAACARPPARGRSVRARAARAEPHVLRRSPRRRARGRGDPEKKSRGGRASARGRLGAGRRAGNRERAGRPVPRVRAPPPERPGRARSFGPPGAVVRRPPAREVRASPARAPGRHRPGPRRHAARGNGARPSGRRRDPVGGPPSEDPRAPLAVQRLLRRRQQLVGARRADGREGEGGRLRAARRCDQARRQGVAGRVQGRAGRGYRRAAADLQPSASAAAAGGDSPQRADAARGRAATGTAAAARRAAAASERRAARRRRQRRAADRRRCAEGRIPSPTFWRRAMRSGAPGSVASSPRSRGRARAARSGSPGRAAGRGFRCPSSPPAS